MEIMRIPVERDATRLLTPEELARRERENDVIRPIWDEKHRSENIVVLSLSDVPKSYRYLLPREGD